MNRLPISATPNALKAFLNPFDHAIFFNGLVGVLRAGRFKVAGGR